MAVKKIKFRTVIKVTGYSWLSSHHLYKSDNLVFGRENSFDMVNSS